MVKILIDNIEYDSETFSTQAKAQFQSIQFVDSELARLQAQASVLQTARNTYLNALRAEVQKNGGVLSPSLRQCIDSKEKIASAGGEKPRYFRRVCDRHFHVRDILKQDFQSLTGVCLWRSPRAPSRWRSTISDSCQNFGCCCFVALFAAV